jgi:hypothetical protein
MNKDIVLLVPEKTDEESDRVIAKWLQFGGFIKKLGKYWIRDEDLSTQKIAIYGNQTFSMILAQIYQVTLVSPDDALIARLDTKWTKRHIELNPEYALEIYYDKMLLQIHFDTRFSSFKLGLLAFHSEKLRVSRLFCIIPSRYNV